MMNVTSVQVQNLSSIQSQNDYRQICSWFPLPNNPVFHNSKSLQRLKHCGKTIKCIKGKYLVSRCTCHVEVLIVWTNQELCNLVKSKPIITQSQF